MFFCYKNYSQEFEEHVWTFDIQDSDNEHSIYKWVSKQINHLIKDDMVTQQVMILLHRSPYMLFIAVSMEFTGSPCDSIDYPQGLLDPGL